MIESDLETDGVEIRDQMICERCGYGMNKTGWDRHRTFWECPECGERSHEVMY